MFHIFLVLFYVKMRSKFRQNCESLVSYWKDSFRTSDFNVRGRSAGAEEDAPARRPQARQSAFSYGFAGEDVGATKRSGTSPAPLAVTMWSCPVTRSILVTVPSAPTCIS